MAVGVSWADRDSTDWLASNGRWYPASNYPRGWNRTALPPAPGQGGIGSILRKYAEAAAENLNLDLPTEGAGTSGAPPTSSRPSGNWTVGSSLSLTHI